MHNVNVDDDSIAAGFSQYEIEGEYIARDEGDPPPAGASGPEKSWLPPCRMAASLIANAVAPNWEITSEVREDWADALADCAEQLMPGGLANLANWGPWARLAFATGAMAMCGIDYETMTLKPLKAGADDRQTDKAGHADTHAYTGGAFTSGEQPHEN